MEKKDAVLISTEVASRGLDFPDTDIILLCGLPPTKDYYINKIGRTARIGKSGTSFLLLNDSEKIFLSELKSWDVEIQKYGNENLFKELSEKW